MLHGQRNVKLYFHVKGINNGFLSPKQTELQEQYLKFQTHMLGHLSWKTNL